jgi:hypothetical protein
MAAIELTDCQLKYLAGLCKDDGNELLERWLLSNTFEVRGIRNANVVPIIRHVPNDAA